MRRQWSVRHEVWRRGWRVWSGRWWRGPPARSSAATGTKRDCCRLGEKAELAYPLSEIELTARKDLREQRCTSIWNSAAVLGVPPSGEPLRLRDTARPRQALGWGDGPAL